MPLSNGARLGPYEIQAAIGAGGMGEVYRARDTRLDRTVAIKILPAELSADPERRTRFEREARAVAALSHPHICTLFDVGEHDGFTYLVMEHLAGESLAERLHKGRLPLDQALTVATETAEALTAAHKQGIIHRDLKPGNLMLTKSGAKLLDFGLAKLKGHGAEPAAAQLASMPTRSAPLTAEGAIVGTLQYVAPEQLEGKPADARTDLWALGAILYEMLTGKRAFEGASAASLITAIMSAQPPALAALQPVTPASVDRLVRRCLAKDPDERWQSALDVADQLRWIREGSSVGGVTSARSPRRRGLRVALLVAGALAMAAAGAGVMSWLRPAAPAPLAHVAVPVLPAESLNAPGVPTPGGSRTALAWTPDGSAIVFVGTRGTARQLYLRPLNSAEAQPIKGTENGLVPAVSPDGKWVAFYGGGVIKKMPLAGGPVVELMTVTRDPVGLAWDDRGGLFFGNYIDGRIWRIPAEGPPQAVTTLGEGELTHILPQALEGGARLLYTVRNRDWSWGDEQVIVQDLVTGQRSVLLKNAVDARYVPPGRLVFMRQGRLFGVRFDPDGTEVSGTGKEVPLLDDVAQALTAANGLDITGAGQFAISATGTLAWVPSPVVEYPKNVLVAVDRSGHVTPLLASAGCYGPVRVSPDGTQLAVSIVDLTAVHLSLYDLDRGTLAPLPGTGEADWPLWEPNGRRLVFGWLDDGRRSLGAQPADRSAPPSAMVKGQFFPASFSRELRHIAAVRGVLGSYDIVMLNVEGDRASVQPRIETATDELDPAFSPNGRWLAYVSNETGRREVYVRPYPGPGPAQRVSIEGGSNVAWNPSAPELFFTSRDATGDYRMMTADFAPGSPPGRPRRLFDFDNRNLGFACEPVRCFDVSRDGQRFYVYQKKTPPPAPIVTHINLIQNWFEELKAKVPTTR